LSEQKHKFSNILQTYLKEPPMPNTPTKFVRYQGEGRQQPEGAWRDLPQINKQAITDPVGYLASPDLAAAVDVASTLGMPLLLTGEPGSGKSRLADSIAWELGMGRPLEFTVKSDTQAQDLFYRYDLIGRYNARRDQDTDEKALASRFLHLEALLYARGSNLAREVLGLNETHDQATTTGLCPGPTPVGGVDRRDRQGPAGCA